MKTFVSLIHTVFNCGTMETLAYNQAEFRHFRAISEWVTMLKQHGLTTDGRKLLQANDPSDNLLMLFTKEGQSA